MSDSVYPIDSSMPGFPVLPYLRVCSESCPLGPWCYLTISPSATPFSFCLPSFPISGSFPMSGHFISSGQRPGASASASVLLMYIQDWFPLGLTGLISLQSKGLSRVFSCTTIWKHQFFSTQPSLWFNSSLYDYWKNHSFDYMDLCWQSDVSAFFNMLSRFVIAFFPRSKHLSISCV